MQRLKEIYSHYSFDFTDQTVANEVQTLLNEHFAENDTLEIRRRLISFIDLTSLNPTDNEETIARLAERANALKTPVAALCVYPSMIEAAKQELKQPKTRIASVCASFPSSQTFIEVKVAEVSLAVASGADEVDVVISLGQFLAGRHSIVFDELTEIKAAARNTRLKVILETGSLNAVQIKQASLLAMAAGADFIKTSTGKTSKSATPEAVYVMCQAIREFYQLSGEKVGIKPSGGISTPEDAIRYYTIVRQVLGDEWLSPGLFRFGATRLLDTLL